MFLTYSIFHSRRDIEIEKYMQLVYARKFYILFKPPWYMQVYIGVRLYICTFDSFLFNFLELKGVGRVPQV